MAGRARRTLQLVSHSFLNRTHTFFLSVLTLLLLAAPAAAQERRVLDRVLAVIDEEIVLESDLNNQYEYLLKNGRKDEGDLRCRVFEQLLTNKLLLARARLDSLTVTDGQIEEELNRRVQTMVAQVGSEDALAEIYGKSLIEMRMDLRPVITDELLIDMQKRKVMEGVEVTPREVRRFFSDIPADSLPYFPAEVELSHIVIRPQPSEENRQAAREKLARLREKLVKGEISFADAAAKNSQDYGSAKRGGSLGRFGRGEMVPEFEEVVYNLEEGQISTVFQSPYGYHIVKLVKRVGDEVEAAHVLIRPEVDLLDEEKALQKLRDLRKRVLADSLSFEQAAREFSDDRATKDNGGRILTSTGDYRVPLDQLDADLYLKIDNMKPGEISEPIEFIFAQGELSKAWRIVFLQKKLPPHRANLKDDYMKFQQGAKQARQTKTLEEWFAKTKEQVYIELKDMSCASALKNWY